MGEFDDQNEALQFAEMLEAAEARRTRPRLRQSQAPLISPDLGADVDLVGRLRSVTPSSRELVSARIHVAEQLAEAMRMELDDTTPMPTALRSSLRLVSGEAAVAIPPARRTSRQWNAESLVVGMRRAGLVAAVLLVLFTGLFTGLTVAAASAPPESPLYTVKVVNESILLAVSWSDELRGNALAAIANHRLNEAIYEADSGRVAPAQVLLGQFNTAVAQLVVVTAQAQAKHEDTGSLVTVVQQTLQAAQTAQSHAAAKGETRFQSDLQASLQAFTGQLRQHGIDVSQKPGGPQGANGNGAQNGVGPNGNTGNSGSGSSQKGGQATPTTTTGSTPVPGPAPTTTPAGSGCSTGGSTNCGKGQGSTGH